MEKGRPLGEREIQGMCHDVIPVSVVLVSRKVDTNDLLRLMEWTRFVVCMDSSVMIVSSGGLNVYMLIRR